MLNEINKILNETNSIYYSYHQESNTIKKTDGYVNSLCVRDLVTITSKLHKLNIKFIVQVNKSILLEKQY